MGKHNFFFSATILGSFGRFLEFACHNIRVQSNFIENLIVIIKKAHSFTDCGQHNLKTEKLQCTKKLFIECNMVREWFRPDGHCRCYPCNVHGKPLSQNTYASAIRPQSQNRLARGARSFKLILDT